MVMLVLYSIGCSSATSAMPSLCLSSCSKCQLHRSRQKQLEMGHPAKISVVALRGTLEGATRTSSLVGCPCPTYFAILKPAQAGCACFAAGPVILDGMAQFIIQMLMPAFRDWQARHLETQCVSGCWTNPAVFLWTNCCFWCHLLLPGIVLLARLVLTSGLLRPACSHS